MAIVQDSDLMEWENEQISMLTIIHAAVSLGCSIFLFVVYL